MKWQRFFLLLFLIPSLIYGLNQQECSQIRNKVTPEWKRHTGFISQFQKVGFSEEGLRFLKESLECCRRAVSHCDTILNDIASQSKSKPTEAWRIKLKNICERDKDNLNAEISQLQIDIQRVQANISAKALCKNSLEKVALANTKNRECERRLNHADAAVSTLNEIAKLYEEATSLVREALALISPYPQEKDKTDLKQTAEAYQEFTDKYKKEAVDWLASIVAKKTDLKQQVATLRQDSEFLTEKGLKRSCYELQKQALSLLEQLLDGNASEEVSALKEEQTQLKESILAFEKEADNNRLTDVKPILSKEEFEAREKERRELFFKSDFLLNPDLYLPETVKNEPLPRVVPLDGQTGQKEGDFFLYTDQFYRFLIQSHTSEPELIVKVLENGQVVHTEKIALPFKNTDGWEEYLRNGMLFIPDTELKSGFGLELRLSFAADPVNKFSLIVSQKSTDLRYQFAISLGQEAALYMSQFSAPPPWQLETLRKPGSIKPNKPIDSTSLPRMEEALKGQNKQFSALEFSTVYPVLDQFIEGPF
jgi:hypothetical protein